MTEWICHADLSITGAVSGAPSRARAAVLQGVGHFTRCPACVARIENRAHPPDRQRGVHVAVAIERQHGRAVTPGDTGFNERTRQPRDPNCQLDQSGLSEASSVRECAAGRLG